MGLLTPAAKLELAKPNVQISALIELEFSTGTERYWFGNHPLTHEGKTWQPTADLGSVEPIESTEDFQANGLKLGLHNLPTNSARIYQLLKPSDYKGKGARFILAFFNDNFQSIIHAIPRHYTIDMVDYEVNPRSGTSVEVQLETDVRYGSRRSVRRYTDQDQRTDYPDDKAFEFISYINSGIEVKWGTGGSFFK